MIFFFIYHQGTKLAPGLSLKKLDLSGFCLFSHHSPIPTPLPFLSRDRCYVLKNISTKNLAKTLAIFLTQKIDDNLFIRRRENPFKNCPQDRSSALAIKKLFYNIVLSS
jgi:hypothetical protein